MLRHREEGALQLRLRHEHAPAAGLRLHERRHVHERLALAEERPDLEKHGERVENTF